MAAAEPIETGGAPGNSASHGNSQHAPQSVAVNASDAARSTAAAFETGGADQEPAFHFNNQATPSTPAVVVEVEVLNDPPVLLSHNVELGAILKAGQTAVEEHSAGHVNNGQHHATVHSPHDLLI